MKTNKYIIITMIVALLALAAACAQQTEPADTAVSEDAVQSETVSDAAEEPAMLELTLEELAQYNGKNGNPAYVAVDGVIYDVSGSAKWKDGEHNGNSAGQDLTDVIKNQSPHGVAMLSRVPAVGKIVE